MFFGIHEGIGLFHKPSQEVKTSIKSSALDFVLSNVVRESIPVLDVFLNPQHYELSLEPIVGRTVSS